MTILTRRRGRVVQPQGPVGIDFGNPIARGLVCASIDIGAQRFDAVKRKITTLVGSPNTVGASSDGYGINYNRSGYHQAPIGVVNPKFASVFAVTRRTGGVGAFGGPMAVGQPSEVNRALTFEPGNGSFPSTNTYFSAWNSSGARFNLLVPFELTPLDKRQTIGIAAGGGVLRGYGNGVRLGSTTGPATMQTLHNFFTGYNATGTWSGFIPVAYLWDRLLEDGEYQALHQDPFQLFKPIERRIWVPVSAGGGNSVGLATEADSALALAGKQQKAAGLSTSTDTALALPGKQSKPVGLTLEADAAFALAAKTGSAVGLSTSSEFAFALVGKQTKQVGLATEADLAVYVPALTPTVAAWTGSAWTYGELKRWTGLGWERAKLKRWAGTAWVNMQ